MYSLDTHNARSSDPPRSCPFKSATVRRFGKEGGGGGYLGAKGTYGGKRVRRSKQSHLSLVSTLGNETFSFPQGKHLNSIKVNISILGVDLNLCDLNFEYM